MSPFPTTLIVLLVGPTVASLSAQVTGLRGIRDHSLCCAIGMPNVHGIDGSYDPAPDPVLSRRRAPAPPPPTATAEPPAEKDSISAASVSIPGADTFSQETPAASKVTTEVPTAAEIASLTERDVTYPPLQMPKRKIEGHLDVGFETLGGYSFKLTKSQAAAVGAGDKTALSAMNAQIPDLIRQLDGKKVMVTGFMLPIKMDGPLTTEFLLVANSMLCCYGVVPPMNQWMTVTMQKRGVKPQQDVPLQVFGTLRIQTRVENGALSAIYHLDGDRTRSPK